MLPHMQSLLLSLLALVTGYLAAWFVWGAALPWLLLLLLGGAALWTFAPRRGQGGWTFSRSLLTAVLLGLSLWVIGAAVAWVPIILSPQNPLPIGALALVPLLLAGAGVVAACLALVAQMAGRARRENGQPVLVPWLWVAGVLAFAALPPVRVDCRGLRADPWLAYDSDFRGRAGRNFWGNHPERIPNRAELPADLSGLEVSVGAARCTQDGAGRSRPFSFRASQPLLVVQLSEYGGQRRTFHAAFTPGEHRKLTPWTKGKWQPFYPANIVDYVAWEAVPLIQEWPQGLRQP